MAWPAILGGAASSLVGGLLGGGGNGAPNTSALMKLYEEALKDSLNLYNSTDYRKIDDEALAAKQKSVMDESMAMLGNYDATAAASGSGRMKSDTAKDRSKTQIAEDLAMGLGNDKLQLYTSEAARKAALLPSSSGALGAAQFTDQSNLNSSQAMMQSIMGLAGAIPWGSVFGGHSSAPGGTGAFGGGGGGGGFGGTKFGQ